MKKIFLLFVSVVLAGALMVSCAQPESPSSFDVTHVTPGAEGVAADKIKAESFEGFILVSWDKQVEASNYQVWRRELDENNAPLDKTITLLNTGSDYSPQKRIPYYVDQDIKDGTSYQYGVSLSSYKYGSYDAIPYSEIVWQVIEESPVTGKRVDTAITARVLDTTFNADVLNNVKATVTPYDAANNSVTGTVNVKEKVTVKIEGLTPGFYYEFFVQYLDKAAPVLVTDWPYVQNSGNSGGYSSSYSYRFAGIYYAPGADYGNYLDNGSWGYWENTVYNENRSVYDLDLSSLINDNQPINTYTNWQARIVVRVNSGKSNQYIPVKQFDYATERLSSNEKVVTLPNATFGAY